jgi:hypothetical protein
VLGSTPFAESRTRRNPTHSGWELTGAAAALSGGFAHRLPCDLGVGFASVAMQVKGKTVHHVELQHEICRAKPMFLPLWIRLHVLLTVEACCSMRVAPQSSSSPRAVVPRRHLSTSALCCHCRAVGTLRIGRLSFATFPPTSFRFVHRVRLLQLRGIALREPSSESTVQPPDDGRRTTDATPHETL